jgi:hypothetical protein
VKRRALPLLVAVLFCTVLAHRAGMTGGTPTVVVDRIDVAASHAAAAPAMSAAAANETIQQFCGNCHNDKTKRGELSLVGFDVARATERGEVAEKMVRKLRTGMMPPKTSKQPDPATRLALVTALETTLDAAAAAKPNPGRRSFQRLNRAEYAA